MVELAVFNHRKHADAEKGLRKRCSLFERKGAWPGVRNRFGGSQDASRKTRARSHSPATTTTPTPPFTMLIKVKVRGQFVYLGLEHASDPFTDAYGKGGALEVPHIDVSI